jgi:hypothetical protein
MKKLTILICAVVLFLSFTNIATATKPSSDHQFTILPTSMQYSGIDLGSSGRSKFSLTASGFVIGYFTGSFDYEERGVVEFTAGGRGTNQAVMTIATNDGTVTIRFQGQTNLIMVEPYPFGTVSGNFVVLSGTGDYEHLHGQGTYDGDFFAVTFTGRFHYDPQ